MESSIFDSNYLHTNIFSSGDRTLIGAITPDQSGPGSTADKDVFHTSLISKTGASPTNRV